jgi:hypothetical protein
MPEPTIFREIHAWFLSLSPEFAFLLALPFLGALAGLLRERFSDQGRDKTIAGKEHRDDA